MRVRGCWSRRKHLEVEDANGGAVDKVDDVGGIAQAVVGDLESVEAGGGRRGQAVRKTRVPRECKRGRGKEETWREGETTSETQRVRGKDKREEGRKGAGGRKTGGEARLQGNTKFCIREGHPRLEVRKMRNCPDRVVGNVQ